MQGWFEHARDIFIKGGPVMWPLLAMSLIAVALIIERAWFWLVGPGRAGATWIAEAASLLRRRDEPALRAVIARDRSILARVIAEMLTLPAHDALGVELAERSRSRIERYSVWLSTIITAAPLLGILGTVTGIIKSFDLLGRTRHIAEIELVATGIAEALITTAFGLVITLVTIFPYMYFRSRADRTLGDIELLAAARLSAQKA